MSSLTITKNKIAMASQARKAVLRHAATDAGGRRTGLDFILFVGLYLTNLLAQGWWDRDESPCKDAVNRG